MVFSPTLVSFLAGILPLIYAHYGASFTPLQYWSFFCFCFLAWWWTVYFWSGPLKIWSLRLFLDRKSLFRQVLSHTEPEEVNSVQRDVAATPAPKVSVNVAQQVLHKRINTSISAKAASIVSIQGIFVAIVGLFLSLVLANPTVSAYQELLKSCVLILATISILLMVVAVDILDTVSNFFANSQSNKGHEYRIWFYRNVGALRPKGGISYAYYGYAFFSAFLMLALSFFDAKLAGIGVGIYTYLSYPFLFGYRGQRIPQADGTSRVEIEIDRRCPPSIPLVLLCFFIGGTLVFAMLSS